MAVGWQIVIVAALAALVGLAELLSRYKSDPGVLTRSLAAALYVILNAAAGIGALLLIRAFGWFKQTDHTDLWRVLIAGFGAITFFRSSFFVTKIGGTNVNVGPSTVLGALLDTADREVDRRSAQEILSDVIAGNALGGLDPQQVMFGLPVICLALMQNFPPGDQAQLGAELTKIRQDGTLSDQTKMGAFIIQLSKSLSAELVTTVLKDARSLFQPQPAPTVATTLPDPQALIAETKRQIAEEPRGASSPSPDREESAPE